MQSRYLQTVLDLEVPVLKLFPYRVALVDQILNVLFVVGQV